MSPTSSGSSAPALAFSGRSPAGTPVGEPRRSPPWSEAPVVHSRVDAGLAGVKTMCPLTARMLRLEGRLSLEVAAYLYGARRPVTLRDFAHGFLVGLLGDEDPLVRNVARFELVSTGGVIDPDQPPTITGRLA